MTNLSRVLPSPGAALVVTSANSTPAERIENQPVTSARETSTQHSVLPIDLILSKGTRRICWTILVGIQLLHVPALAGFAFIYADIHTRDSLLWLFSTVYLLSDATMFLHMYSSSIAASFALFAVIFALMLFEMLFYSIRYRQLAFGQRVTQEVSENSESARWRWCSRLIQYARNLLMKWNQTFGIRGRYFLIGLMAQETIEIALQTSQAYATSKFVSNLVLNLVYGLLICTNCISTVLVYRWLREDSVFERLVCVMIDLVLDFVWGVVLPFLLFYPRLSEYANSAEETNPGVSAELIRAEIEHSLILSPTSFAWSFFPFLSTVWNIIKLRRLLVHSVHLNPMTAKLKVLMQHRRTERINSWQLRFRLVKLVPKIQHYFHSAVFVFGVFVFCVSIHASGIFFRDEHSPFLCVHQVYPWFAMRRSCSMRRINCTEASIVGTNDEIASAMDLFNANSLMNLEIVGCSELEMPPALLQFTRLRILAIKSSVIKHWPTNASVVHLPALVTLKLYGVALDDVPEGILAQPASMEWISIFDSDIGKYEQWIGAGWSMVKYLYCDACGLTSISTFVHAMSGLLELSACYNAISDIPDALFSERPMNIVYLDGNPLQSLPSSLWQPSLFDLYIQYTNVSIRSEQINEESVDPSLVVRAAGSPLCENGEYLLDQFATISNQFTCEEELVRFG